MFRHFFLVALMSGLVVTMNVTAFAHENDGNPHGGVGTGWTHTHGDGEHLHYVHAADRETGFAWVYPAGLDAHDHRYDDGKFIPGRDRRSEEVSFWGDPPNSPTLTVFYTDLVGGDTGGVDNIWFAVASEDPRSHMHTENHRHRYDVSLATAKQTGVPLSDHTHEHAISAKEHAILDDDDTVPLRHTHANDEYSEFKGYHGGDDADKDDDHDAHYATNRTEIERVHWVEAHTVIHRHGEDRDTYPSHEHATRARWKYEYRWVDNWKKRADSRHKISSNYVAEHANQNIAPFPLPAAGAPSIPLPVVKTSKATPERKLATMWLL